MSWRCWRGEGGGGGGDQALSQTICGAQREGGLQSVDLVVRVPFLRITVVHYGGRGELCGESSTCPT